LLLIVQKLPVADCAFDESKLDAIINPRSTPEPAPAFPGNGLTKEVCPIGRHHSCSNRLSQKHITLPQIWTQFGSRHLKPAAPGKAGQS